MLEVDALSVGYARAAAPTLQPVSLAAEPGAFICLLGRNGAGKSTLLRTLAGLQPPLAGEARLDGETIHRLAAPARARRIAVVLTERVTAPGLTVRELAETGRQPFTGRLGRLSEQDRGLAEAALVAAGAAPLADRSLDALSDGERQRAMIARAIAQEARLLLLDEVTAFLDLPGRVAIMAMLRRHARDSGAVVVLSSHDLDLSLQLADALWLLDGRGALVAGDAEALSAGGALGRAFDTPDVTYDPALRRFQLHG